ncbi:hypothetical protein CSHISOI_08753 [Colletotrichum shisoi]|uniref:Uncharacterized protein n=1 Tax=Colletotrichum shisoi TaxID=2078593 RepID=A0A5Q4BIV4_9PEZI|nr:hypothetical protein CSHISOI_08753 [Colletotrichum shisoi]
MSTCMPESASPRHDCVAVWQLAEATRQDIAGQNMDPEKLVRMLETNFPGAYEVEMAHNTYSLRAPRKLSIRLRDVGEDETHGRLSLAIVVDQAGFFGKWSLRRAR